ncbi:MAG: hypothetical protein NC416_19810, partial [Eubacterium sp.]|nr:hypothetical protein [Eubacterium sp.]
PTLAEIDALIKCGVEVIAMDATDRRRHGGSLDNLFREAKSRYPEQLFMADCSNVEEGIHAAEPGIDLIESISAVFANYPEIDTEIIAASVRNPIHVTDCALAGADIATVPYSVIEQMTKHPLTDQGITKFQADYKAVFGE